MAQNFAKNVWPGLDRFSVIFSKKLTFLQHVEAKFILRNFYENLVGGEDRLQIVVLVIIVFYGEVERPRK